MPQPLSRVMPSAIVIMCNAGDRPLNHNPELGLLAMEAIISWSNVERFMLNMYLKLMGGSQDLAAVSFLAQTTQNAKEASINAVAKHVLDEKYFELLRAILTASKPGQLGRDKLAHWTWGYSPNIPDGFLLADPRNTHTDFDRNLIFVYKKQDFIDIIKLNDELCGFGLRFRGILTGHIANKEDKLYHELCSEPLLRDKLPRRPPHEPPQTQPKEEPQ
ncbi:MAG: hypothetical protein ING24_03395 [Roseomonas sp.]|nr:hypothetical protein [Roseomonas sp.]MCA3341472.1 hypothetical protein [Roseomonas sp.]